MSAKNLQRQVDAIELSVVVGAILQMVDHLQRGAQRVGRRPKGMRFAVDIENEPPHRHRRQPAIVDELRHVGVAPLGHVLTERAEEIESVNRRQTLVA